MKNMKIYIYIQEPHVRLSSFVQVGLGYCMTTAANPSILFLLLMPLSIVFGFGRFYPSLRTLQVTTKRIITTTTTSSSSTFLDYRYCQGLVSAERTISSSTSREMAAFEPSTNTHIVDHLKEVQTKIDQVRYPCTCHA